MVRSTITAFALLAGLAAVAVGGGVLSAPGPRADASCALELRSWVVAGRGRHLYLQCECPEPHAHLSGRIEFTRASQRVDAQPTWPQPFDPIARMSPGVWLRPVLGSPRDRLEAQYRVGPAQAAALQQDRVFSRAYRLLGPNSNSAIREVMEQVGLMLPRRVVSSGSMLGVYPGVHMDPGEASPPASRDGASSTSGPEGRFFGRSESD
ncbi:MAG: hypothetical protein AAFX05_11770 [Planctomycetota bacterium]